MTANSIFTATYAAQICSTICDQERETAGHHLTPSWTHLVSLTFSTKHSHDWDHANPRTKASLQLCGWPSNVSTRFANATTLPPYIVLESNFIERCAQRVSLWMRVKKQPPWRYSSEANYPYKTIFRSSPVDLLGCAWGCGKGNTFRDPQYKQQMGRYI